MSGGLFESAWNLMQPRQVVLIVLDIAKRRIDDERRVLKVDAVKLRHGHFPVLEPGALNLHAQAAHHQHLVEPLSLREAGWVDRFEPVQRLTGMHQFVGDRLVGVVI